MSNQRQIEIPELFPQPKQITLTEGNSDLSVDIRLVTSNVLPVQRKAIRSILTATGVKVVANKKKYVVDAAVIPAENFDLSQVPDEAQQEYYELEIKNSEVFIKAPFQEGTVWAAQTLAALYKRFQKGQAIPNLHIKDWPVLPTRGIFVENKWGSDRMSLPDWYQVIDAVAAAKLNTLGVGLYGCWGSCRFEGPQNLTEFLMVPVPEHEELKTTHRLRWFSPENDDFKDQTYLAPIFENDFFADVITYGRERGVAVVPYINSLGHNTFIPRICPELSAKTQDGTPAQTGYCLSNPKFKAFIKSFYESIVERYYPNGISAFHIQLDEIYDDYASPEEPQKKSSPWCQCPDCRKKSHVQLLQDYILWLTGILVNKGVQKVVLWNDTLTRHEKAFTPDFIQRIKDAGLQDHIVFDFWDYSNQKLNPLSDPKLATEKGLHAWVTPMTCYYDWSTYSYHLPNIGLSMDLCYSQHAEGAVSYSVHNPSHLDHEAALAGAAWENTGESAEQYVQRWVRAHFNQDQENYLQATRLIREASELTALKNCLYYHYVYVRENWPSQYPGDALDALMKAPEDNRKQLEEALQNAEQAQEILTQMTANEQLDESELDCLRSLTAEAARVDFLARAFICLLDLKISFAKNGGTIRKTHVTACQKVREELLQDLTIMEKQFPIWLAPAALAALTPVFEFIGTLEPKLNALIGKKKAATLEWNVPYVPPAPPAPVENDDLY